MAGVFWLRKKFISKLIKFGVIFMLLLMLLINIKSVMKLNRQISKKSHENWALPFEENYNPTENKTMGKSSINVKVYSSKTEVSVSIDDTVVYKSIGTAERGIHVLVLNQATGAVMAKNSFDTFLLYNDEDLIDFLKTLSIGRIIIFAIKDEGTYQLGKPCRTLLKSLGSLKASTLYYRDMWAMVTIKGNKMLGEVHKKSPNTSEWADGIQLMHKITLTSISEKSCDWGNSPEAKRRKSFCDKYEGYGSVCKCKNPTHFKISSQAIDNNGIYDIPVIVIASNRPHYLLRMLKSLLSADGVNLNMITVFVDGYYEEPSDVASLFGIRVIKHTPTGIKNARISQHYKASITATFNQFPEVNYVIIFEEDLDISPDIFGYFSQVIPLLKQDNSLYCASAWNDQGYSHSCKDPSLLYRVETMPGLGWLLSRKLYKEELEEKWPAPEKRWDWDMWMRTPGIRQGRECIIPDVSRTYHFGSSGVNMNSYFQGLYFKNHTLNKLPQVKLKNIMGLKKDEYETFLHSYIPSAKVLDHTKDPCDINFIPITKNVTYSLYIKMHNTTDFGTWKNLAKCLHLWDLDIRGVHKLMWRFFLKENPIVVIGHPFSPYSKYKPVKVLPVVLESKDQKKH